MEIFSRLIHQYLFHGPLWFIHKTHHHRQSGSWFEWNDLFSLFFAAIALWLMWRGRQNFNSLFWIGAGISLYGLLYFLFHDGLIHNRFKTFKASNRYLAGIRKAHTVHHKAFGKSPSQEFGLLTARFKYFRK